VRTEQDWVRECERRSFTRGDLAYSLATDPGRARADLVTLLARSEQEFFADDWRQSQPRLEATATLVRRRLRTHALPELVASLSKMASTRGSTTTVYFDKLQPASGSVGEHGLLLVPSMRSWPHVLIKLDPNLPVVVHFPAQDALTGQHAQSQEDIRRRLLVLADPARWELCRHLINEPITTTELATRTGLATPAVSRHLRVMREAGLISSHKEGRQAFHRLHPTTIDHLGIAILQAIIR
jgi:DNA-binding transcriptional ArsR family regulator